MPSSGFPEPGVVQDIAYALQLALGAVFLASAVPKLRRPGSFYRVVEGYELAPSLTGVIAPAVILIEAALAVFFLTGWFLRVAAIVALVLLAAFAGATAVNLRRGKEVQCGCFGDDEERISGRSLVRLGLIGGAALGLAVGLSSGAVAPTTASHVAREAPASLAYLVEVAGLSVAVTLFAVWLLHARELRVVLRSAWPVRRGEL